MLEGPSCLISRDLPNSCEEESKWIYNAYCVIELANGKRKLENEELTLRKSSKPADSPERDKTINRIHDLSISLADPSDSRSPIHQTDQDNSYCVVELSNGKRRLENGGKLNLRKSSEPLNSPERDETINGIRDLSLSQVSPSDDQNQACEQSDSSSPIHEVSGELDSSYCVIELSNGKFRLENGAEQTLRTSSKSSDSPERDETMKGIHHLSLSQADPSDNQYQSDENSDSSSLIHQIGRDNSINCLLRCSRSDYGSIAFLNWSFRSLIRDGELYRLRRQMGIVEHWVYFSCSLLEWEAFDPIRHRWMHLPRMTSNECFMCSDKESLAVGTELLVFGKEIRSHVIYRYSILTNSWSSGMRMNTPRCLFGSASLGEIAIFAGGCDPDGKILSSAELYNSETGTWETLPSMNKARKMCSGVFMDRKFYVIGGIGVGNPKLLTCGEVYDLESRTWHVIPDMFPPLNGRTGSVELPAGEAPPLVAVVNNELYAADYANKEVRKYDKERNLWVIVGRLPEQAFSMNGWGLAFRACGDQLIVIGGPRALGGGIIEVNSWVPAEGSPQWNLLARKHSGSFVYNCAVMGC